jgi:fimbrial chaperone protein
MRIGKSSLSLIPLMAAILTMALGAEARAGAMQVSPILIDAIGQQTASITLRNGGDYPLDAQVRVFRWSQEGGADHLEPTDVVVASPPLVTLRPNTDYAVRLVHQGPMPTRGEESYRLLIDELPNAENRVNGVALLVRQSIPVFFAARERANAQVTWRLEKADGALIGVNEGDRRLRVADLKLNDDRGARFAGGAGLRGYVLGHSTVRWTVPRLAVERLRGHVVAAFTSESGPTRASVATKTPP